MSHRLSRRNALRGIGSVLGTAAAGPLLLNVGCGSPAEDDRDDGASAITGGCKPGATGLARYDHIVILMMENRSFDHVFGYRSVARGKKDALGNDLGGEGRSEVRGLTGDESNPTGENHFGKFGVFRPVTETNKPIYFIGDIDHEWQACHEQLNYDAFAPLFDGKADANRMKEGLTDSRGRVKPVHGLNDGFVRSHRKDLDATRSGGAADCATSKVCAADDEPMAVYNRQDMPIYGALADRYSICDNSFASVIGPTWPNRFYMHLGTALGATTNEPAFKTTSAITGKIREFGSIWTAAAMTKKNGNEPVRAVNYFADTPWALGSIQKTSGLAPVFEDQGKLGRLLASLQGSDLAKIITGHQEDTFEAACKKGTLPDISIIDPPFLLSPGDDHPPHHVHGGQAFVGTLYNMLYGPTADPTQAARTLFIITYDEHGSFYDHVAPPTVGTEEFDGAFQQLGFRIPTMVLGPGVKKGSVSHTQYDHVSLLKTLTVRFGIDWDKVTRDGGLSGELRERQMKRAERIAKANSFEDCIDKDSSCDMTPMKLPKLRLEHDQLYDSIVFSSGQAELHPTMGGLREKLKAQIERLKNAVKGVVAKETAEVKSEHINHFLSKAKEYGAVENASEGRARGTTSGDMLQLTVEAPEHAQPK